MDLETTPEERLRVITVATKGTDYRIWEKSAKRFGYRYRIEGQDRPWQGFKSKIEGYLKGLEETTEEYCMLVDCTDLFFVASAAEAVRKFEALGCDLLIGGEKIMCAPGLKLNRTKVRKHFARETEGVNVYPNSGFLMGTRTALLALMQHNANFEDDQTASIVAMYEGSFKIMVDTNNVLIANVPNYLVDNSQDYLWDEEKQRWLYHKTNETPIAFHFPGKNWSAFNRFYRKTSLDDEQVEGKVLFYVPLVLVIIFLVITLAVIFAVTVA